ncbi:MAG: peptidoglycan DD-metalloendopeptidase family protein [Parvularculaceae bacterium]
MTPSDQSSDHPARAGQAPGRAPLALGVAVAVIACGVAFLAIVIQSPTRPGAIGGAPETSITSARSGADTETRAEAGGGDYGAVVWPGRVNAAPKIDTAAGPATIVPPTSPSPVAPSPVTPDAAKLDAGPFGAAIRVKPKHSEVAGNTAESAAGPRLKPSPAALGASVNAIAASAPTAPATVLSLATRWLASEDDRPPPFFFASDLVADRATPPPLPIAYARDIASAPREVRVALTKGETFVDALRRAGVRADDRNEAAYAFGKLHNLRALRPGETFQMTVAEPYKTLYELLSLDDAPAMHLIALDYRAGAEKRISLSRADGGGFVANSRAAPLTTRIAAVNGRIDGSLYLSAKRQGAPDEVIAGLAQMFAYDVDFQREIFGGDEFEAIFEVRYDETGRLVAGGDILYGRLKWRGRAKEKGYYRFAAEAGGRAEFFDASGESARRLLMKTPIDGARLSSGFGTRRHPILGYAKAHKGVDFAASRGTPIMAAGDGVIEKAGPFGTFGNYIRIRHAQGYKTAYAHMNSIKKGVRAGARVRQGEVIGTVGSTGRSTGPHLHYEVHLKDRAVNPQSLKIATGYELGGHDMQRFKDERDSINAMRLQPAEPAQSLVADNAKNKSL